MRQTAIDWSIEEVKNAETACEVAKNQLRAWPPLSGAIRGSLDIDQLPKESVDAMDRLDVLAQDPNSLTDFELGEALGLRIKLINAVIKEIIKEYAPEILELIPAFL
jgi:hypothetical protein